MSFKLSDAVHFRTLSRAENSNPPRESVSLAPAHPAPRARVPAQRNIRRCGRSNRSSRKTRRRLQSCCGTRNSGCGAAAANPDHHAIISPTGPSGSPRFTGSPHTGVPCPLRCKTPSGRFNGIRGDDASADASEDDSARGRGRRGLVFRQPEGDGLAWRRAARSARRCWSNCRRCRRRRALHA